MGRNFTLPTIKTLFAEARSCGFPDCDAPLVFRDRGAVTAVADIAHIRSESPTGPRHESEFRGDLNGHENLILLCGTHHRAVDRHETLYSIDELLEWKRAQVEQAGPGTKISDDDARAYARLSEAERLALAQLARVIQRLADRASRASADAMRVAQAFSDAHQRAYEQMGPMFTVDDDGNRHRVQSDAFHLPPIEQQRWQGKLDEAIKAHAVGIQSARDEVSEESAVLRMQSPGLRPWLDDVGSAADALAGSVAPGTTAQAKTAADVAVSRLWSAATGEGID